VRDDKEKERPRNCKPALDTQIADRYFLKERGEFGTWAYVGKGGKGSKVGTVSAVNPSAQKGKNQGLDEKSSARSTSRLSSSSTVQYPKKKRWDKKPSPQTRGNTYHMG